MPHETEGGAVPMQSKGSWSTFLKSIASFNGDLSSLTAPAFILSTFSLTEFSAYWTEHPSIFVAPAKEPDPEKRALLVLKWFLSTLKQSYCSRSDKLGSEKKPLNPFLGELFIGKWEDESGETTLISEQVSHHPPVTAYCITNNKHGIRLQGYNAQKASFSRTIHVKQIGHALLTLNPPNSNISETYLITLPALHIESLIYGSPFVELNKYTHIASSTGYVSKIDYSGKGWLSGKKNSFTASMWKEGEGSERHPLYSIDGQWNDSFAIKKGDGGKHAKAIHEHHAKAHQTTPLIVAPIEEQDSYETRRAWRNVAQSIAKGDMDATSYHKSKIEVAQRELRAQEKKEGRDWERTFFRNVGEKDDALFHKLVNMISGYGSWAGVEPEKTSGIWRFDDDLAKNAKKPYHREGAAGLGEQEDGTSVPASPVVAS